MDNKKIEKDLDILNHTGNETQEATSYSKDKKSIYKQKSIKDNMENKKK